VFFVHFGRHAIPSRGEMSEALAGNLCRCTGYHKILEGIEWAAARMRGEDWMPPSEAFYGSGDPVEAARRTPQEVKSHLRGVESDRGHLPSEPRPV